MRVYGQDGNKQKKWMLAGKNLKREIVSGVEEYRRQRIGHLGGGDGVWQGEGRRAIKGQAGAEEE